MHVLFECEILGQIMILMTYSWYELNRICTAIDIHTMLICGKILKKYAKYKPQSLTNFYNLSGAL